MKITFACSPGLKNYVPLYSNNNDSNYDNDIIDMMNNCYVDDFSDSYYDIIDMMNSCCMDDFSDSCYRLAPDKLSSWGRGLGGVQG